MDMPVDPSVSAEPSYDAAQCEQLRDFERDAVPPEEIRQLMEQMELDREYVHTDANLPTTPGGVSTNYIWRYQQLHQSQVYAKNPSGSVRPRRKIGDIPPEISQQFMFFSETMELLIQQQSDEANFKEILSGVIQDVDTVGLMFVKLSFIESDGRDPAGVTRPQDFKRTMDSYQALQAEYADSKFTDQDAKYQKMVNLADTIKKQHEGEMWRKMAFGGGVLPPGEDPRLLRWNGLPSPSDLIELPKYRGFVLDPLDPEDVRWQWSIKRPEMIQSGRHITYRTFMFPDDIRTDYHIAPDDDSYFSSSSSISLKSDDVHKIASDTQVKTDVNATERQGAVAVWVREDRELNKIITWVHGAEKPLSIETPEVVSRDWFTIYPVYFNRVTGRIIPLSNVLLGKQLQDEINLVRTHKRQAKRAAYNRYIVEHDILGDGELDNLNSCPPEGWVPTNKTVKDLREKIFPIAGHFNAEVHDVLEERQELGSMLGQSQASQGMTQNGSDSATEASIANQSSETMADKHRGVIEELLRRLYTAMGDILVQVLPEENVKAMCGPGAVWPMADKIAIWNHLEIEIEAGSTGKPDQRKDMDSFQQCVQIGQMAGIGMQGPAGPQWNLPFLLKKMAKIKDWREDPMNMVIMPPPPLPMPPPGMPMPPGMMPPGAPMPPGPPMGNRMPPMPGGSHMPPDVRAEVAHHRQPPPNMPEPHMAHMPPTPDMLGAHP